MKDNIPRAAIHVGKDKKSFSAQVSNEAERRGWDKNRYQLKNAEHEKNNHYNFSRKHLNFEITKGGKIAPLGSTLTPLHERLQRRYNELSFKPYMDADHPDQISQNSPNCTVGIIFSGDHDVMNRLAFGDQEFDTSDPNVDCSGIKLQQPIYDWAIDTYHFACRKWGEENVIGFCVHCDETSIHAHVQTVPVEQVKKRGRIGSMYISNENPEIQLSTKEWKALPKEERTNYTKTTATKDMVERVSYAKVWGETRKEKSAYLSQLHTDYHNEVGCKYGLERGIPYTELSDEEKRERRHKDKVTLEAERQAKAAVSNAIQENLTLALKNDDLRKEKDNIVRETEQAKSEKEVAEKQLDGIKEYAVLATIDKKELTFPLLNIKKPIQDVKKTVAKELSIPVPAVIGQKAWREERCTNINTAIEALVDAINTEHDRHNEGVHDSMNKAYTYYMQNLNKLIKENKSLRSKNDSLNAENTQVKKRISELDENAVKRVTAQKDGVIHDLKRQRISLIDKNSNLEKAYAALETKYRDLVGRWNDLWKEPEFKAANDIVQKRRLVEERKRNIINRFISEGCQAQREFALQRGRTNMTDSEALRVYYAIIAILFRDCADKKSTSSIQTATASFLDSCDWSGMTQYQENLHRGWTGMFVSNQEFTEDTLSTFIAFIDHMSCSADTYVSLSGSGGCANQLNDWNDKKKRGLGDLKIKKGMAK